MRTVTKGTLRRLYRKWRDVTDGHYLKPAQSFKAWVKLNTERLRKHYAAQKRTVFTLDAEAIL